MPRARVVLLSTFAAVAAGLAALAGGAAAETPCSVTWAGGNGSWSTAAAWSGAQVPGATDVVCLEGSGYTVTVDDARSVAELRVAEGVTLAVRAGYNGAAALTVASGSNAGTIYLDSADRYSSAALTVGAGTLTNTGTIVSRHGPADCCVSGRSITGSIANSGTLDVQWGTTYTGALTNTGTVTVSGGHTLTFAGASSSLTHAGGTIAVSGALNVSGGTFAWTGGTTTGNPPNVGSGHVVFSGTAERAGEVRANGASDLTGDVPAGVTVRLRFGYNQASVLSVPASLTNAGTIVIDAGDRYGSASLLVAPGQTLTNTGELRSDWGTADCCADGRTISGNVANAGTFVVGANTSYDGTFTNTGTATVNATLTLNGAGTTFAHDGGTLAVAGAFVQNTGTFSYAAGTITGAPVVAGGTVTFPGAATRDGEVRVHGATTVASDVPEGVTLRQRTGYNETSTLTFGGDTTNAGTIVLDADQRYGLNKVVVPPGSTLTNTGTFRSDSGPVDCCDYEPRISGDVDNDGVFRIGRTTTMDGLVRNSGTFTTAAGHRLTLTGDGAGFHQLAGTLSNQGAFVQDRGTFRHAGGDVTGNQVVLVGNRLEFPAAEAPRAGSYHVRGTTPALSGDVPAGVRIDVRPDYNETTKLSADASFTNAGTIVLDHGGRYSDATLAVAGTMTNDGTLRSAMTGSDCCVYGRTFRGGLVNNGTLDVAFDLLLDTENGTYTSTGTVAIAPGRSLNASGKGQVFELAGGTLDVQGALNLGSMTFRYTGGSVTGTELSLANMDVQFGSAAAAVPFVLRGTSTLTGDVPAGQVVAVRAPYNETATLTTTRATTNAGTIVLDATGRWATAVLDVRAGGLTNTGTLASRLGTADCCQNGRIVKGDVTNTGEISVETPTTYTGTLTNDGTVTVTANGTLSVNEATSKVRQRAGAFHATGWADVRGGTLEVTHGAMSGVVGLENGALAFADGASASGGEIRTRGTTAVSGDVPAGTTVRVRSPYNGYSSLVAAAPFTNRGTIALDHDGRWGATTLALGEHVLTNAGEITGALGNTDCCSTEHVTGTVVNDGTIAGSHDLSLATVTNNGTIAARAGQVKVSTLTNWTAETATLAGGTYDVANGAAFRFGGAPVAHNAARVTLSGSGAVTNLGGGDLLGALQSNSGRLAVRAGKELAAPGAFANTGTVRVLDGARLATGGTYTQSGVQAVTSVSDAEPPTEGEQPARFAANGTGVVLDGGVLDGNGRIMGDLVNAAGHVMPGTDGGPGRLTVDGGYAQGEDGTTTLAVEGLAPGEHSALAVGGAASLGGTLGLASAFDSAPPADGSLPAVSAASVTGAYAATTGADLPGGWVFEPAYTTTSVELDVTERHVPANPALSSPSHSVSAWSRVATVQVAATGASDAHSGVAGFSHTWSTASGTVPDTTVDAPASFSGTASPVLLDGSHWFHLRTVDAEGNWSDAVHLGPFRIDRTLPAVPGGTSASHPAGFWRNDPTVDVTLSGGTDAASGRAGWSYAWTTLSTTEPDATVDGTADAVTSPALPSGLHYLHVRAVDAAGNAGPVAHLGPFRVDVTAPKAAVVTSPTAAAPFTIAWSSTLKVPVVKAAWTGAGDADSGVAGYRVAYRSAPSATAAFGTVTYSASTTASSWSLNAKAGTTYCIAVETKDRAGNVAPLSAERCVTTPVDNGSLTASKTASGKAHWTKVASSGSYFGTVSSTTTYGASLKTGTVKTRRIALVVDKCSTCGSVKVYLGSTLLGTYSLAGSGTHVVIPVKTWTTTQTGVVTVKVASTGKAVKIDAIGVGAL